MDPWRIGLLVASVIFVLFLLVRLRPRLKNNDSDGELRLETAAERRVWSRLSRMPRVQQERILARLEAELSESDDEPADPGERNDSRDFPVESD